MGGTWPRYAVHEGSDASSSHRIHRLAPHRNFDTKEFTFKNDVISEALKAAKYAAPDVIGKTHVVIQLVRCSPISPSDPFPAGVFPVIVWGG